MKKILSKSEIKKRGQKMQLIAGLVLVGLMVFSTIAYSFMSRDSEEAVQKNFVYNGLGFIEQDGYFFANNGKMQITLLNDPRFNNISVEMNLTHSLNNFYSLPLYLDSEDYLSSSIILQNLGPQVNGISQRVQLACFDEENCDENYPIKDCSENLIVISYSNESKIESVENCIFISGKQEEITQITDKLILTLIG